MNRPVLCMLKSFGIFCGPFTSVLITHPLKVKNTEVMTP